jgi:hypothetical protein
MLQPVKRDRVFDQSGIFNITVRVTQPTFVPERSHDLISILRRRFRINNGSNTTWRLPPLPQLTNLCVAGPTEPPICTKSFRSLSHRKSLNSVLSNHMTLHYLQIRFAALTDSRICTSLLRTRPSSQHSRVCLRSILVLDHFLAGWNHFRAALFSFPEYKKFSSTPRLPCPPPL